MSIDVKKVIKDLGDTDFGGSNEEQGKMVSLMKGLAFSDDPLANKFMKAINKATTEISKKVLKENSTEKQEVIIEVNNEIRIGDIILEKGDRIKILEKASSTFSGYIIPNVPVNMLYPIQELLTAKGVYFDVIFPSSGETNIVTDIMDEKEWKRLKGSLSLKLNYLVNEE